MLCPIFLSFITGDNYSVSRKLYNEKDECYDEEDHNHKGKTITTDLQIVKPGCKIMDLPVVAQIIS